MVVGLGLIFLSPLFGGGEAGAWKCDRHPERENCEGTTTSTEPEERPACPCDEASTTVSDLAYVEDTTTSSTASSASTTVTTGAVTLIPPEVIHSDPHPPPAPREPQDTPKAEVFPVQLEKLPVTGGVAAVWAGLTLMIGGALIGFGRPSSGWRSTHACPERIEGL